MAFMFLVLFLIPMARGADAEAAMGDVSISFSDGSTLLFGISRQDRKITRIEVHFQGQVLSVPEDVCATLEPIRLNSIVKQWNAKSANFYIQFLSARLDGFVKSVESGAPITKLYRLYFENGHFSKLDVLGWETRAADEAR